MNPFSVTPIGPALRKLLFGHGWWKVPGDLASQKVCLLASHAGAGKLSRHTLHLARQWQAHGFKVLLIVASRRRTFRLCSPEDWCGFEGVMLRENRGYDFGSWADAMRSRPDLHGASLLAVTNDSVYGPLRGFANMLARVEASDADVIGMTDSYEFQHHLQSYLIFYRLPALQNATFRHFWASRTDGGRDDVIQQSELPLLRLLQQQAGLRVATLFPSPTAPPMNPTLLRWRELLANGFPFVKVQVLRDGLREGSLAGWEQVFDEHGFDPTLVREHLHLCA